MKKQKLLLEYSFKSVSPSVLFPFISTARGFSIWFADTADSHEKEFIFTWNNYPQVADLIHFRLDSFARFHWQDEDEKYYFEFRIVQTELSGDTALHVIDFIDPEDIVSATDLWDKQIESLKRAVGIV